MIAPGIRVCRGPDWIWQNQGESRDRNGTEEQEKGQAEK